jgi:hypothetical protein
VVREDDVRPLADPEVGLVVDAAPPKLLLYAADVTCVKPGLRPTSTVTAALAGLTLRFCPALETTRIRSTIGLKSKPKSLPINGVDRTPTRVAAPFVLLMV